MISYENNNGSNVSSKPNLYILITVYKLHNFFLNWDSLHARPNSHYEAWSYKKKKQKKIRAHCLKRTYS